MDSRCSTTLKRTLPPGTTLGRLYFASDSTQLSMHSGDVAAHGVYMTLANKYTMAKLEHRPKAVRTKLLGVLNRQLFHRCMDVITRSLKCTKPHNAIDPEGNVQSVLYELVGYIADLEEQWMIAGLGGSTCPHCACNPMHLGDAECSPPRSPSDIFACRVYKPIRQAPPEQCRSTFLEVPPAAQHI